MRTSLQWMRDFAPLDAPLETLSNALVETGTEVEDVRRLAEGTVVARIVGLSPVPEATRSPLLIAEIDTGGEQTTTLITGASNLGVGDLVPYAPPGTLLPGWDEPLGTRMMLGKYPSPGMLLSSAELGIGEDAEGIRVLDHGVPGQAIHEAVDTDALIDVAVTTNRPDCLSQLGIARELAAALGEAVTDGWTETIPEAVLSAASSEGRLSVRIDDPDGCPRFCAVVIENVAVGPSPFWLRRRLEAVGLRPINNVVDVTNYVAAELGQPLHAFDLDRFIVASPEPTGAAEVVVRRARRGERLLCLDGVERVLDGDLVVSSGDRVVSLAGVIGGRDTAVDEGSRSVLLEAASWDWVSIRSTSNRLQLRTDASSRFDKGLSDTLPPPALRRAAALIAELGAGHVLRGQADEHPAPLPPIPPIDVPEGYLESILGCPTDPSEAATALARLGFSVEQDGGALRVLAPHWRRDVAIPADVVEEVGRSLGYGRVPSTLPGRRTPVTALAPAAPLDDRVREVCAGAGFDEVITYSFTSRVAAARLGGLGRGITPLPLLNPLSEEWSVLRTSLLPGLCLALAANLRHEAADVEIFEVGRAFWEGQRVHPPVGSTPDGADSGLPPLPAEPLLVGLLSQTHDGDAAVAESRLRRLQAVLAWLVRELAGGSLIVEPMTVEGMNAGRCGALVVEGRGVGVLGELEPSVADAYELRGRVAVAELRLDAVAPEVPRTPRFHTPARMPAVVRDLAVIVPEDTRAGTALAAIREAGGTLLESAELYDEYRDDRLGPDRKGYTFRLVYRAPDRTLTGAEVQSLHEAIATALRASCGAEVRA
ncbi:MAG: phenylalanine--tRNA ligase subunit beta [Chloroflexi bacterium]|nr:MAG: phenylalanine--tRNA ligase subunit beta [Chloroflexota bacterium]